MNKINCTIRIGRLHEFLLDPNMPAMEGSRVLPCLMMVLLFISCVIVFHRFVLCINLNEEEGKSQNLVERFSVTPPNFNTEYHKNRAKYHYSKLSGDEVVALMRDDGAYKLLNYWKKDDQHTGCYEQALCRLL